jgi:hypothetical protein
MRPSKKNTRPPIVVCPSLQDQFGGKAASSCDRQISNGGLDSSLYADEPANDA